MEPLAMPCALCGKDVGGAEPAHAVHDKLVCEACRRRVAALEPRRVLPYADDSGRSRRRWVWPAVAAGGFVALLLVVMLLVAVQRAAVQRARAEEMRALAAEAQARAAVEAAVVLERRAQTRPAE